jgi:hypothetical protein
MTSEYLLKFDKFFQIRGYGVGRFQLVEAVSVTRLAQICIISWNVL